MRTSRRSSPTRRRRALELGTFYSELDRLYGEPGADVEGFLREALRRARLVRDERAVASVANELGSVLRLRGELRESEGLYDEVPRALEATGADERDVARALVNLGDVYVAQGRNAAAIEAFDRAERMLGDGDENRLELSAICNNRSSAYRGLGRFSDARADLRRAGRLLDGVPGTEGKRATNAINLAQVLTDEGRIEEAAEVIAKALVTYETLGGGRDVHRPHALATAARIAYLRGDYVAAEAHYLKAAEVLREKLGDSPNADALERRAGDMRALR